MSFRLLCFYLSITYVHSNVTNDLIIDYFYYKKVSGVVGYSCNGYIDDMQLLKNFNNIGITVALNKLTNISMIKLFGTTKYYKLGIIVDTRCHNKTYINSMFLEATNGSMYGELYSWLIIGYNLDDIRSSIDDEAFGISTDFVIAILSGSNQDYLLYDAFNIANYNGGTLNITVLGDWNNNRVFNVILTQTKLFRRSNLNGLILRVSFFKTVYKPLNVAVEDYFRSYTTTKKEGLPKFGYSLLTHLSELFNFRLKCVILPKWEPGDRMGPLVRSLVNNDADIVGSAMAINVPRTYWIKFLPQIWPTRTCFIFRNPQPANIKIQEILRPFEDHVWYLMVILICSATFILAFVARIDWIEPSTMRLSQSFILMIGAICQQGTNIPIMCISTRIAFFSVMMFGLLIYNYYSTSVVSARFNEPIVKINDSLSELSKLPLEVASEYLPFFSYYIKKEDWETKTFYEKRWAPLSEIKRFIPLEVGLRFMKHGGFAYHTSPDVAYPYIDTHFNHRELCELMEVHLVKPTLASFAVKINSTIVELIRYGTARLIEVGLSFRQVKRWKYKTLRCRKDILSASSIEMNEFAPHLLLLFIGFCISTIIYIIEIIIFNLDMDLRCKRIRKKSFHFENPCSDRKH